MTLDKEEAKLLGSIHQKLSDLCEDFKEFKKVAVSDTGFTRCAVHRNEMKTLKKMVGGVMILVGLPIIGIGVEKLIAWFK